MDDLAILSPQHVHAFATTPAAMEVAQKDIIQWAIRRTAALEAEITEARAVLEEAKKNGFSVSKFSARLRRLIVKRIFLQKVRVALEAGYYIVPPFPVQIFAVRTTLAKPKYEETFYSGTNFENKGSAAPVGEGRYVRPIPNILQIREQDGVKDGVPIIKTKYWPDSFREEIDFPFTMVKPEVINATGKALRELIFDRLGILPSYRTADPIIVGQIEVPTQAGYSNWLTFFVAWWLDTSDILK